MLEKNWNSKCGKKFLRRRSLENHQTAAKKPFKCSHRRCCAAFINQKSLIVHQKTHNPECINRCKRCHRTFPSPSKLRDHYRKHSGLKPFVCLSCGKGFQTKTNRRKHWGSKNRPKLNNIIMCELNYETGNPECEWCNRKATLSTEHDSYWLFSFIMFLRFNDQMFVLFPQLKLCLLLYEHKRHSCLTWFFYYLWVLHFTSTNYPEHMTWWKKTMHAVFISNRCC